MSEANFLVLVLIVLIAVSLFEYTNKMPKCEEDEALYWHWESFIFSSWKEYVCLSDPAGCHLLVEQGQLKSEECESNPNCVVKYGSSCMGCLDIFPIGCYPKDMKNS